jgi:hypothetical protein
VSADFHREERTRTVVRHVIAAPAHWTDVQKLLRVVIQDMGYPLASGSPEPSDDAIWYEIADDSLALCYRPPPPGG